eukprot:TRINITY_DN4_c0_g2_i1.p1 TRINITY_DN4_c0_g2~~TRINITY_DN4_c0_g2_i1.p1  ORF type:complete len:743 (-),score=285.52 TRINITY_DN4_c0_g2_i1:1999-4227(-)
MAISGCTSDACKVASGLLDAVALVIEDIKPCETELETTFASLKTALSDWESQKYVQATHELSQALLNFQSSLQSCGLNDFAKLIDSEARALNHSNINVEGAVSVLVNDVEFASDIAKLASDAASESWPQVGQDLGALILDLQRSSCQSDACSIVISLASELQIVIQDLGQCKDDLDTSFSDFKGAVSDFQSKNYISAVKGLATGLDSIAESVKDCQLEKMAQILVTESAKLKLGNISEVNNIVSILVKDADVYDAIFGAVSDASQSNWAGFGGKIGNLVNDLQLTEHCSSPMCQIIEALLESMEVVGADLSGQCATDLENSWDDLKSALTDFKSKNWRDGLKKAASTLHDIGSALNDCNLSQLALIVQKAATQLGASNVTWISGDIKILISGGDIVDDLLDIGKDFGSDDYSAVGQSLGDLITRIGTFKCSTPVCVILNGILEELQIVVTNLKACESDIGAAYTDFENLVHNFHGHHYGDGLKDLANGLYKVADGIQACQLPELADKLNAQAQQLGISQVKKVDNIIHIASGGAAIYEEIFAAVSAFESHNFRSFGNNLGKAFLKLMTMSSKFGCSQDEEICTLVQGALQGLNLIQDLKKCKADLKAVKTDFEAAFADFRKDHALSPAGGEEVEEFFWSRKRRREHREVKAGLKELGQALDATRNAIVDCDLEQFAELIAKLVAKLGGATGFIGWLEEAFKIIVEGVNIFDHIKALVHAFEQRPKNWLGIGFNIAELVKELV